MTDTTRAGGAQGVTAPPAPPLTPSRVRSSSSPSPTPSKGTGQHGAPDQPREGRGGSRPPAPPDPINIDAHAAAVNYAIHTLGATLCEETTP